MQSLGLLAQRLPKITRRYVGDDKIMKDQSEGSRPLAKLRDIPESEVNPPGDKLFVLAA